MRVLYGDWRDVFKGFRTALDPRKITLAVGGISLSMALLFLVPFGVLFSIDLVRVALSQESKTVVWDIIAGGDIVGLADAIEYLLRFAVSDPYVFSLIAGIAFLAVWYVWAYFAGGISRIAAVEIARDERIELNEALQFAREKFRSIFWAPIAIVLAIVCIGLLNVLIGLVARVLPWGLGQFLMSSYIVFALFIGFLMAWLVVGLTFSWPLMVPTICTEGTDGFDAISRSISYLYARPWRYLWCKFVAAVYGIPCIAFVAAFTALLAYLGIGACRYGMGTAAFVELDSFWRMSGSLPDSFFGVIAAIVHAAWMYLLIACAAGYAISYALTSHTIIYMVLRRAEDGTEMTEVFDEEEDWEDGKDTEASSEGSA
jgi:hypothetical protein